MNPTGLIKTHHTKEARYNAVARRGEAGRRRERRRVSYCFCCSALLSGTGERENENEPRASVVQALTSSVRKLVESRMKNEE